MRFARYWFAGAGIYGLLVLTPQLFLEAQVGRDFPPPITHPEYFYGFTGVALACQVLFLVIARDPIRMRPAMLPASLEKFAFAAAAIALWFAGRLATSVLAFGLIDLVLGLGFVFAWLRTPEQ